MNDLVLITGQFRAITNYTFIVVYGYAAGLYVCLDSHDVSPSSKFNLAVYFCLHSYKRENHENLLTTRKVLEHQGAHQISCLLFANSRPVIERQAGGILPGYSLSGLKAIGGAFICKAAGAVPFMKFSTTNTISLS